MQRPLGTLARIATALAVAGAAVAFAAPVAQAASNYLATGATLAAGETRVSDDGSTTLTMTGDCNLVLTVASTTVWSSGTAGAGTGCRTEMRTDGNLVVYTSANAAVWNSGSAGHSDVSAIVRNGRLSLLQGGTAFQWWSSSPDPQAMRITGRVAEQGATCASADVHVYWWLNPGWQDMGYLSLAGGVIDLTLDSAYHNQTFTFSALCRDPGKATTTWLGGASGTAAPTVPTPQNSVTLVDGKTVDLGTLNAQAGVLVSGTLTLADGSRIPCNVAEPKACPVLSFYTADAARRTVAWTMSEPDWQVLVPPGSYDVEVTLEGIPGSVYPKTTAKLGRLVVPASGLSGLAYRTAAGPAATNTGGPAIAGRVSVGATLTATPGEWDTHGYPSPGLQFSYQWWVAGVLRATSPTFVPRVADGGKPLAVTVIAGRPAFTDSAPMGSSVVTIDKRAASSIRVATPKLKAKTSAKFSVTVVALRAPTGKVVVRLGGKKLGSATLSAGKKGKVKIKIKGMTTGTHTLTVSYGGSKAVFSSTRTLTVTVG